MSDPLPLDTRLRIGTMAAAVDREQARRIITALSEWGYESVWCGDHVAFTGPMSDPLTQLTYFSAINPNLTYGTSVYLLPLRHPTTVAKVVATLDRLMGAGHFVFGVGVGGEFPPEYEACGVPLKQRGGRANEGIQIIKRLWSGEPTEYRGKYFSFGKITMLPKPLTPGGPPIWVGGRAGSALRRAAWRRMDALCGYAETGLRGPRSHVAFTGPVSDPLAQLTYFSRRRSDLPSFGAKRATRSIRQGGYSAAASVTFPTRARLRNRSAW